MRRALLVAALAVASGCGTAGLELRAAPATPFDVLVVPGCPSEADGRPSRCQIGRALWAAIAWERGWTREIVTSGADVHTPFVEADALGQLLAALGVPSEHIHLERNAFHTDENMYFSLRVARRLGARTVAVASTRGHALWACRMLLDWGQPCRALPLDEAEVAARARRVPPGALEALRLPRSAGWTPLGEREHAIAARTGRRRPPSWLLYAALGALRAQGAPWVPALHGDPTPMRWSDRAGALAEMTAPGGPAATP